MSGIGLTRDALRPDAESLPAPVLKMPFELLLMVFSHSPPWTYMSNNIVKDSETGRMRSDIYVPAVNLALVCKRWNEIATKTPQLWTTISLSLHYSYKKKGKYPEATRLLPRLVQLYLDRSKNLPLDVSFAMEDKKYGYDRMADGSWELLVVNCERWKRLSFTSDNDESDRFNSLGEHLPLLEAVSLHTMYHPIIVSAIDAISAAPRLQEFHLTTNWLNRISGAMDTVTHLSLLGTDFLSRFTFPSGPQLRVVDLRVDDWGYPRMEHQPIILPGLEELNITRSYQPFEYPRSHMRRNPTLAEDREGIWLSRPIHGDVLKSLSILINKDPLPTCLDGAVCFMQQSQFSLTYLKLSAPQFTDASFFAILKSQPLLETLVFSKTAISRPQNGDTSQVDPCSASILPWIAQDSHPHLQTLELSFPCMNIPDEVLAAVVSARATRGTLKKFRLIKLDGAPTESGPWIALKVIHGFHLDIHGPEGRHVCSLGRCLVNHVESVDREI
jgi:hypothetical protein